jgi:hypothetical protein
MGANDRGQLPADLIQGRSRFRAWRGQRKLGERIPQPLWALAVRLARMHGVSRTATVLGVDYYSLQKRSGAATAQGQSSAPAFVEWPTPIPVGKQCRLTLDNGAGATMRAQLVGYDAADIEALARSFWNAL